MPRLLIAVLLLAFMLMASACGKKPIPSEPTTAMPSLETLANEASTAFNRGDYARSELLYERLLERGEAGYSLTALAHERYAVSALEAGHYRTALEALDEWNRFDPAVVDSAAWNEYRLQALAALGDRQGMVDQALAMADNDQLGFSERRKALDMALDAAREKQQLDAVLASLAGLYADAPDAAARLSLERYAMEAMAEASPKLLAQLSADYETGGAPAFPGALAAFELARRRALQDETAWPGSWRTMRDILQSEDFELDSELSRALRALETELGTPGSGVVLALPLSGRFKNVGWSILRGAGLAQWQFATAGSPVEMKAVNTDAPDWREQLAALGPGYRIVGGPLLRESLQALNATDLQRRSHFVFRPSLGEDMVEGKDAWRFFGSPQDQVRSLVRLAVDELGLKRFALLYPDEPFGLHMSQLFWEQATKAGARITGLASYPPGQPTAWGKKVAELLQVPPKDEKGDREIAPDPDFEAVFMPDGWGQARLLAPQFHFYEEDRLLLLGPELWSQGLVRADEVETRYFRLSACPGAWWADSSSPGVIRLKEGLEEMALGEPDFWTALGYDFMHLAARLADMGVNRSPETMNRALSTVEDIQWSLAPMSWDDKGRASQWMYLFKPAKHGLALLNPELLAMRLEHANKRHEERTKARQEKEKAKLEAEAGANGETQ